MESSFQDKADACKLQQIRALNCLRSILFYLCGEFIDADRDCRRFSYLKDDEGTNIVKLFHKAYLALNYFALASVKKRKGFKRAALRHAKTVRLMARGGSPTSQAITTLLSAEHLACSNKVSQATEKYGEAIKLLGEGKLFLLEAIAYERLGLCLKTTRPDASNKALQKALNLFQAYGATIKVDRMLLDHGSIIQAS